MIQKYKIIIWSFIAVLLLGVLFMTAIKLSFNSNNELTSEFTKKVECGKLINRISEEIKDYNQSQKIFIEDNNVPQNPQEPNLRAYINHRELGEIFYSRKIDSCILIRIDRTLINNKEAKIDDKNWSTSYEYYYLIDALTGEELKSIFTINRSEKMDSYNSDGTIIKTVLNEVEDAIAEYKK